VSCTKRVEEAVKRRDYIDYGETEYGVHALVPEARVFDKVLGWREVYTVWARLELGIVDGDDPLTAMGALFTSRAFPEFICGPQGSYTWTAEGSNVTPCQDISRPPDFSRCRMTVCAPVFYLLNNPSFTSGYLVSVSYVSAATTPLSGSSVSECNLSADSNFSGKVMGDLLYLCRYQYADTTNLRYITTFSAWDKRSATYSFTHAALGQYTSGATSQTLYLIYPFGTTYNKGSTDIYRFLYDVAVSYQSF